MPVRSGKAFVLRDQTIPLLSLADLLRLPASDIVAGDLRVLIVQAGSERIGIAVDAIAERAETLLRPLSGLLRGFPGIAGTTLLGDGKVLLVLDLEALIG
jgi:two-component system chemotaxis sensor kinase CheA